MNKDLLSYITTSKLSPLLANDSITDISYNGAKLFYQHNLLGRKKSSIDITKEEATSFIRQIANMAEKQFSYLCPILDISVGNLRINAVHSSIVRIQDEKTVSFCIRVGSYKSRIEDDTKFMNKKVRKIIQRMIDENMSIVIAGQTGSGKTELQKYLLMNLKENSRVIIIDNIQELDSIRQNDSLDITSWQLNQNVSEGTFERLIRNALRSNPDWLVIAESRGKEMNDILNSVLTGHPIITTLHADNVLAIPERITRMVEMSESTERYDDIHADVIKHIRGYIFLKRYIDKKGHVHRYVNDIAISDGEKLNLIYTKEKSE